MGILTYCEAVKLTAKSRDIYTVAVTCDRGGRWQERRVTWWSQGTGLVYTSTDLQRAIITASESRREGEHFHAASSVALVDLGNKNQIILSIIPQELR